MSVQPSGDLAVITEPLPLFRGRWAPYVVAGIGYLVLTSIALFALIALFTTATPGIQNLHADFALFHWNIWWFQHAIFGLGQDPYFTNYILFPNTVNLAYHTLAPLLNVFALPIYATLGLTAAINSWIVMSLVFNGLTMFAFLRHHVSPLALAFIGGALFAFTSSTMSRVTFVHLNMVANGWLPLSLLAWDWLSEQRTYKWAILLGVILYAALMTDIQFLVWLALLLPAYAVFTLVHRDRRWRKRIIFLGILSVMVLLALSLVAPLPQLLAGIHANYGEEYPGIIQDWYSIHWSDLIAWPPRVLDSERATLGFVLPLAIVIGFVRGRKVTGRFFWLTMGGFFLLMAFGPTLEPFSIPLPYQLFSAITRGTYRVPARFILPAVFALITFAVLSLKLDFSRLTRMKQMVVAATVLIFVGVEGRWYEPLPVFNMPDYPIYHEIGADPTEYLLLEVPVGPHNLFEGVFGHGGVLQYYAPIHHKQLINGAVSRAPVGLTDSYRQWPLITALAEEGPLPSISAARQEFERLSQQWDIRYVIIHRDMLTSEVATWAAEFFNTQTDWCLVDEEGPLLAYTRDSSQACLSSDHIAPLPANSRIDFGSDDERYLNSGWYYGENIGGLQARWTGQEPAATLRVNLMPQAYCVIVDATTFVPNQIVTVTANGTQVADFSIGQGWSNYVFELPVSAVASAAVTNFSFVYTRADSPNRLTNGQSQDQRVLAVAYSSISFVLKQNQSCSAAVINK